MTSLSDRRARSLGAGYELFYDEPLHLVRGEGVRLFDADGREYLDCYNNVPSVGHCHPRVVNALCEQAGKLNTHTRYLHDNVVELAERLGSSLAGDLSTCWFTCTGSEANDLAVQVARAATGRHGVIVFENSYHGNTTLVHALSPDECKADRRPDWVVVVEPPNQYRGPYRAGEPDLAERYAALVAEAAAELDRRGHGVAALLLDASWDANGVIVPPDGYLDLVVDHVRAAGGLVIADEVQAGYCRLGDEFWGHARYGVVPDIVTMGKPMGAGHPVAACVTTPAISSAFGERYDYFNTFGGNPVSAAVALAVLDVIEDEGLLANATATGRHLGAGLQGLVERHELAGSVQGTGLFWGLELVADRHTREPLPREQVRRIVSAAARRGVLTGLVGPYRSIVKVRPPLPFRPEHADRAIEVLEECLAEAG